MRRRTSVAAIGLVLGMAVIAGLSLVNVRGLSPGWAVPAATGTPDIIEVIGRWIVVATGGIVVLAVLVLLAHQYVRWEAYRPAIHLAVALLAFVAGLAWLLGPVGVGGSKGGLTAEETRLIRVGGAGLLFFLVLYVARVFHDAGDGTS